MHPLEGLREEFNNATKTVLKENISKNIETLNSNRDRITKSYNHLISSSKNTLPNESQQNQDILKTWLPWARARIVRSYEVLNCNYLVPENFDLVSPLIINSSKPGTSSKTNDSASKESSKDPGFEIILAVDFVETRKPIVQEPK